MKSFYTLLFLSIVGVIVGLAVIFYDERPMESQTEPIPQLTPSYKNFIAGTGIVESDSKNIQIGSIISGVIEKVNVKSGDSVTKGELLFTLDDRAIQTKTITIKADIESVKAKYLKAKHQLQIIKDFKKISPEMVIHAKFAEIQDNVSVAKTELDVANSKLKALQKKLLLYKVYSPINGMVLKSKLSVGKYFQANGEPLILGSDALNLRVNINEYDVWKFQPNTKAIAFVRGHPELKVDLTYLYTMPYMVSKKNLTGISTERTDTRVLQVLFTLPEKIDFPLYVGQQLDVFVQSKGK